MIHPSLIGHPSIHQNDINTSDPAQTTQTHAGRANMLTPEQTLQNMEQIRALATNTPVDALPSPEVSAGTTASVPSTLNGLPDSVGTDIYAMMALFQKIAQDMRTSARETRQAESEAQVTAQMAAADKIMDAAKDRLIGAIIGSGLQIAGGVTQFAGGVAGAKSLTQNATAIGKNDLTAQGILSGIDKQGQKYQGASTAMGSGGQLIQGIMDHEASKDEAAKARLEADAQVHGSASDQAKDLMNQMMDVIRDVRDKLSSIEQSRQETNRGIARNI